MKKENLINQSIENINSTDQNFTETDNGLNIEANNINLNCLTSRNNNFSMDSDGNLTCNSITTNEQGGLGLTFDDIYPVGSIYLSVNDINPGTIFTGTWEKITDRFLVGAGNSYNLGSTGGVSSHTHTSAAHSHTSAAHTHSYGSLYSAISFAGTSGTYYKTKSGISYQANERKADAGAGYYSSANETEGIQVYGTTGSTTPGNTGTTTPGNTGSSSNIPPYLAINIWKRIS